MPLSCELRIRCRILAQNDATGKYVALVTGEVDGIVVRRVEMHGVGAQYPMAGWLSEQMTVAGVAAVRGLVDGFCDQFGAETGAVKVHAER